MRKFLILLAGATAAIGVGMGIEAALRQAAYGPPNGYFTASFPGAVRKDVKSAPAANGEVEKFTYSATGGSESLSVSVMVIDTRRAFGVVTYRGTYRKADTLALLAITRSSSSAQRRLPAGAGTSALRAACSITTRERA